MCVTCAVERKIYKLGTMVDTNVLISLLSGEEEESTVARLALETVSASESLMVPPVVYAELVAGGKSPDEVEKFFDDKQIAVVWSVGRSVWREAGVRYGRYARDRRRQRGDDGPRCILADFLVGACALYPSRTLLTSDAGIFGTYFPELEIIVPEDFSK